MAMRIGIGKCSFHTYYLVRNMEWHDMPNNYQPSGKTVKFADPQAIVNPGLPPLCYGPGLKSLKEAFLRSRPYEPTYKLATGLPL